MSENVYMLWFYSEGEDDEENALLIGVCDSEPAAKAAIERLRNKPGFVDYAQGFRIYSRELGKDSWTEGFIRD